MATTEHPALRFRAPGSIVKGTALADLMDARLVGLIAESVSAVQPGFDATGFRRAAGRGLTAKPLMERARHIGDALGDRLPTAPTALADALVASLGPPLIGTEGLGLAVFFYLPHVCLIGSRLSEEVEPGLRANYAVTRRFSAEYSIRHLLLRHQEAVLAALTSWTTDPDPHVRRLVSEGTRPRLPWGLRLHPFVRDPSPTLPLLDALKDDVALYVRRSVANHLADIAKDHPTLAFATARRWLDEAALLAPERAAARRWIVRHAIRLPAKQGVAAAVRLRRDANGRG